ncbi:MAG: hypothetical protein WBP81_10425 [Solirubrobacteraceae bacterium]
MRLAQTAAKPADGLYIQLNVEVRTESALVVPQQRVWHNAARREEAEP